MLRWIGAFLLLELFFHLCLTHAVFSEGLYNNAGMPTEVFRSSVISTVFALQYSWWVGNAFKIAAIFGFARTWAVVNGMVPPAMRIRERFPQSLTSILTCWKSTHYSLYLWVIRYIYVPLGGKKHRFSRNYLTAASGVLLGYMIVWSQWANGYVWLVALALLMLSWLASIVTRRMASIRNMQRGKSREGKLFALGLHIFALPIIVMGSLVLTTILFFNANPDVYYQLVQPALAAESAFQTVQSALLTFSFFVAATHWANRINLRRWRNQGDDAPILPESMYSSDSEI
jgi:D-alanyl-lipoteichoic acid acyltransferase DltB (MBOAT superfamily)